MMYISKSLKKDEMSEFKVIKEKDYVNILKEACGFVLNFTHDNNALITCKLETRK